MKQLRLKDKYKKIFSTRESIGKCLAYFFYNSDSKYILNTLNLNEFPGYEIQIVAERYFVFQIKKI